MPQETNHSPHSAFVINYPLVWIPRDRQKVLVGQVEARLKAWLAEIATQSGFEILAVEVTPDPVHRLVSAPAKFAPAEMVRLFKGITWRRLKKAFESLRRQDWGKKATWWAEGYWVGTAGQVRAESIQGYLEESQKRYSFQGPNI